MKQIGLAFGAVLVALVGSSGIAQVVAQPAVKSAPVRAPLCPALKQLIAAASETPSFKSVVKLGKASDVSLAGTLVPGAFATCDLSRSITPGIADAYACDMPAGKNEAQVLFQLNVVNATIARCLGVEGAKPGTGQDRGTNHLIFRPAGTARPTQVYTLASKISTEYRHVALAVEVGGRIR